MLQTSAWLAAKNFSRSRRKPLPPGNLYRGAENALGANNTDRQDGMTKSEELFRRYCASRGYEVSAIPTESNVRRTADFRVAAGGVTVVVEVEEITANDEDRRLHYALREGRVASGGGIVGRRARGHIRDAADQLKSHVHEGSPAVVVLYDNVVIEGQRQVIPYTDLETFQIDAAMYGFTQVNLVLDNQGVAGSKPDTAGGGRITTRSEKLHVSAVCVLYDISGLRMVTYHNHYASIPLPLGVFSGDGDVHLRKPLDTTKCPGEWVRA